MIFFLQPTAVLSAEALINIGNKGKSNYLWLNYKFRFVPRISNTQNICSLLNFRGLQTWRGAQWGEVLHVFSTGVIHNPSLSQLCEKGENESMESHKPLPQPAVLRGEKLWSWSDAIYTPVVSSVYIRNMLFTSIFTH